MIRFLLASIAAISSIPTMALSVAVSTTQIHDFARNILGDRGRVIAVLGPGVDPHTYQPTPGDLRRVSDADVCVENGLHLEGKNWMRTLCVDAGKRVVTATESIKPLAISEGGETISDPHSWFSVGNAAAYVKTMTRAFAEADPEGRFGYEARAELYLRELRVLDGWIREQISRIPVNNRVLVTSHDAFNYFCDEYRFNEKHGFRSLAPVGWSTGAETGGGMTPARRTEVVNAIRSYQARAIFVETTVNPKQVREIAGELGVRVGPPLYSDSMGDKGSGGETYIGMMRENVLTIVQALL